MHVCVSAVCVTRLIVFFPQYLMQTTIGNALAISDDYLFFRGPLNILQSISFMSAVRPWNFLSVYWFSMKIFFPAERTAQQSGIISIVYKSCAPTLPTLCRCVSFGHWLSATDTELRLRLMIYWDGFPHPSHKSKFIISHVWKFRACFNST